MPTDQAVDKLIAEFLLLQHDRIAAAFEDDFALARFEFLHDDPAFVPAIVVCSRREREEHGFTTRQELRTVCLLPILDADQKFRPAATG